MTPANNPSADAVELLPCPFCESMETEIVVGFRGDTGFGVRCARRYCRALVGGQPTREQAISAWNRRAALSTHASPAAEGALGPMQRCPVCHAKFQQVHDVDEHLATLRPSPGADAMREAAINQNAAMRVELAHIGNLVSDLERALRVDPANADGSWPNLAGRIEKLKAALTTPTEAPAADPYEADIAEFRAALHRGGYREAGRFLAKIAAHQGGEGE